MTESPASVALSLMNNLTPEGTDEAERMFRKAADIDPGFGRALACASWCYRRNVQLNGMILSAEEMHEGLNFVERALATDPTDQGDLPDLLDRRAQLDPLDPRAQTDPRASTDQLCILPLAPCGA